MVSVPTTPRTTSTKTRIKTFFFWSKYIICKQLQEQLPLKQGLRLSQSEHEQLCPVKAPRTTSTKTRIKTDSNSVTSILVHTLQEQLPLKQGLRPICTSSNEIYKTSPRTTSTKTRIKTRDLFDLFICIQYLQEQLPLKQGLRPFLHLLLHLCLCLSKNNFH